MKSLLCFVLLASATLAIAQDRRYPPDDTQGHVPGEFYDRSSPTEAPPRPDPYKQPPDKILKANPNVAAKLAKLLPAGITPKEACAGFRRMGDCAAAIHAAQNLGVPFADLKAKLTADNAPDMQGVLHQLKPEVKAKAEAKKAEKQADKDLGNARVI